MTRYRLHWLSRIPHRVALVALAFAWLSSCVVTQSPEPTAPPPHGYPPEAEAPHGYPESEAPPPGYPPGAEAPPPVATYPSAPYRNPGPDARRPLPPQHRPLPPQHRPSQPHHRPPAADCSQSRPEFACCKALTPECNACVDHARAAQEQWDRECVSAGPVEPDRPAFDCNEAPGGMCCEANTAECNSCRRAAAAERAAWARECRPEAPTNAPPPSEPVVNCSEPPGRMCCQAETAACHSCRREAEAERAAWERQCR
jgi:hypothetical protein